MASLLSLLPSEGLLFSTALFPQIMGVECAGQRRGSLWLWGRREGAGSSPFSSPDKDSVLGPFRDSFSTGWLGLFR